MTAFLLESRAPSCFWRAWEEKGREGREEKEKKGEKGRRSGKKDMNGEVIVISDSESLDLNMDTPCV